MTIKTTKWDGADHLDTPEAIAAYLEAAFEDGDAAVITHALGNIARAKGISQVAKDAGVTRAGLYRALSPDGDPKLKTLLSVFKSLGLAISVHPA